MKKNSTLISIIISIILALIIVVFLLKTNIITLNHNETNKESPPQNNNEKTTEKDNSIYKEFINSKDYLKEMSEAENINSTKYAYYDLDKDGKDELIIYTTDGSDFETNYFYTQDQNEVKFISKIYHYGNLTYSTKDSAIIYTETRPSLAYGYAYGFYKLNNNKFELIKSIGVNIENGEETYFLDDKTITKEEYNKILENYINFDYTQLN